MVLPAYAGMILRHEVESVGGHGAPRVCGDDPAAFASGVMNITCSPRMRG